MPGIARSVPVALLLVVSAHGGGHDLADGLLFRAAFDQGLDADHAVGNGKHRASGHVEAAEGFAGGGALIHSADQTQAELSFAAPGNVDLRRGTFSFWLEPAWDTAVVRAPSLFNIGGALRLYYEPTVPALVVLVTQSDGKLLVLQATHRLQAGRWVHVACTWDSGARADLYIDGRPAASLGQTWQPPALAEGAGMHFDLTVDLGGRPKVHPLGGTVDELRIHDRALGADGVAALFAAVGGRTGAQYRYEQTVDFGMKVRFGKVISHVDEDVRVEVRTTSGQAPTWSDLTWGGPTGWARPVKVGRDGTIASEPGRHLKLIFAFQSPVEPERLPLTALRVTYAPFHGPPVEAQRVLDPADARPPAEPVSRIPLSDAYETPHVRWGRPYRGGTTRALILTHLHNQREIVELAQRMDVACDTASTTKYAWLLSVASRHRGALSWPNVLGRLEEDLATHAYDVIVIGGAPWKRNLNDAVRDLVLSQVRRGAGLVAMVDPQDTTDDLAAVLPLKQFEPSGLTSDPIWAHSSLIGEHRGKWRSDGGHFIVAGVPFEVLPEAPYFRYAVEEGRVIARAGDGGDALVALGRCGEGRVVHITCGTAKGWGGNRSLTPHVPYDTPFHYWEYYLSLVGRSMLWAAGREPDVAILSLTPRGEVVVPGPADDRVVRLVLENHGPQRTFDVEVHVRDERWATVARHREQVRCAGDATCAVAWALPDDLAGGAYVADTIVRQDGQVVNWGSACFRVTPIVHINDLAFDRPVYDADQPVRLRVALAATAPGAHDVRMQIALFDTYDRLLGEASRSIAVSGAVEEHVAVDALAGLTPFIRARATVLQGRAPIDRRAAHALTRRSWRWDDYRPIIWSDFATTAVMEYLRPHYIAQLREMGFDAIEDDSHFTQDLRFYCRQNMQVFPIGFGGSTFHGDVQSAYERSGDVSALVREPCLHDPDYRAATRQAAASRVDGLKDLNPLGYVLADETSLTAAGVTTYPTRGVDICFSAHTMAAFRRWLREEYDTLEALNAQWETAFTSWDAVLPATKEQLLAAATSNYASWSDHRTFMEKSLAEAYGISVDVLKRASPDVPVGLSGTSPPATYTGFDYARLGRLFGTHWMYYTGSVGEMWRSFNPRGSYVSCQGYGQSRTRRGAMLWDTLLNGHKGALHFTMPIFINPDLTLSPDGEDLKAWHAELKGGVGKVLIAAERLSDPIAILYSQRGIQAAWITGAGKGAAAVTRYESLYRTEVKDAWISANEVRHLDNMDTWCNLLEGAGFQYDFVTPGDVAAGRLEADGYRALVLPWVMPIDGALAEAMKRFVHAGGMLIADVLPGIMDGRCRTLSAGRLDDVFGVTSSGYRAVDEPARARLRADVFADMPLGDILHDVLAGPRVAPAGALHHAEIAAEDGPRAGVFIHRHGAGTAVLLNLLLANRVDTSTWANQSRFVACLLARAGLEPRVRIAGPDPFTPHYEAAFFRQGPALEYLGVVRRLFGGDRDESITIALTGARHVYDVRKRAYLGERAAIPTALDRGDAAVFALFPYRVAGIDLAAPATCRQGEAVSYRASVRAAGASPGDHVVRVEVRDGRGRLMAHYSGNRLSASGVVAESFHLALNDSPGTWRITATEVASGLTADAQVVVSERVAGGS